MCVYILEGSPPPTEPHPGAHATALTSPSTCKTHYFPGVVYIFLSPQCLPSVPCASGGVLLEGPNSLFLQRLSRLCSSNGAELLSPLSCITIIDIDFPHPYRPCFFLTFICNLIYHPLWKAIIFTFNTPPQRELFLSSEANLGCSQQT